LSGRWGRESSRFALWKPTIKKKSQQTPLREGEGQIKIEELRKTKREEKKRNSKTEPEILEWAQRLGKRGVKALVQKEGQRVLERGGRIWGDAAGPKEKGKSPLPQKAAP